jgi:hypothetical protein
MPQIVSGQFRGHDKATQAVWALHDAGLPLVDIILVSLSMQPDAALSSHTPPPDAESFDAQTWWAGFLEALLSRHLDPHTLQAYTEAIHTGKYLMLAHGTADHASTARQVLERSGASDIEVRVTADEDQFHEPARYPAPTFPQRAGRKGGLHEPIDP